MLCSSGILPTILSLVSEMLAEIICFHEQLQLSTVVQ